MANMRISKTLIYLAMLFAYLLFLPIYLCLEAGFTQLYDSSMSGKTSYQGASTGSIVISYVSPQGKYIKIENTSSGDNRRDVDLNGWKLKQIVVGKRNYIYRFKNVTLKPGKSLKIFARGSATEAGMNDLIFRDEDSWGEGSKVVTSLLNKINDEMATYTLKTLYN